MANINNNVETMFWLRDIVVMELKVPKTRPPAFRSASAGRTGRQIGAAGVTVRQSLRTSAWHARRTHVQGLFAKPWGPIARRQVDILDFGALDEYGCFTGSSAVVVFSNRMMSAPSAGT